MLRRLWRTSLIISHISSGLVLLVATGAVWNPHTTLVKKTKQWWLGRIPRILGMDVHVSGNVPNETDGPLLLVSNHVSWVDIPLIGGVTPTCFLAKSEVAQWPLIGTMASKAGTLFIRRGSGDTANVSMAMADTLKRKRSVLFFPEGTTTNGTYIKRFHSKLFKVCHHHQVSVQPIVIRYWTLSGDNPVPFIDDQEFTQHLWNMMGHGRLYASIDFLPRIQMDPEYLQQQVSSLEGAMRLALLRHDTATLSAPADGLIPGATPN